MGQGHLNEMQRYKVQYGSKLCWISKTSLEERAPQQLNVKAFILTYSGTLEVSLFNTLSYSINSRHAWSISLQYSLNSLRETADVTLCVYVCVCVCACVCVCWGEGEGGIPSSSTLETGQLSALNTHHSHKKDFVRDPVHAWSTVQKSELNRIRNYQTRKCSFHSRFSGAGVIMQLDLGHRNWIIKAQ